MPLNIVLVEPEIPHNTGSIARTCALTGTNLHLVKPLGFSVEDKYLKRAGLDYWHLVNIKYYDSLEELIEKYPDNDFYFATTKTDNLYTDFKYKDESFLSLEKKLSRRCRRNWPRPSRNTWRCWGPTNSVLRASRLTALSAKFSSWKMSNSKRFCRRRLRQCARLLSARLACATMTCNLSAAWC